MPTPSSPSLKCFQVKRSCWAVGGGGGEANFKRRVCARWIPTSKTLVW